MTNGEDTRAGPGLDGLEHDVWRIIDAQDARRRDGRALSALCGAVAVCALATGLASAALKPVFVGQPHGATLYLLDRTPVEGKLNFLVLS